MLVPLNFDKDGSHHSKILKSQDDTEKSKLNCIGAPKVSRMNLNGGNDEAVNKPKR